jgi:enamine deaminase RidA (YjgF/YER057c/UK114 family)
VEVKRCGHELWLAGHGPIDGDKILMQGQIGSDLTLDQGIQAAQLTGLSLLATINEAVGLDAVEGILSVRGFVWAVAGFTQHPTVIDGCSKLFAEVYLEPGKHVRCALGVASLPFRLPVEIECVALLHEGHR